VGTALLDALIVQARQAGVGALSLSVEEGNPAARLYERLGFVRIGRTGSAWTMLLELADERG
jgi:ribosomal protein S18 acetylase RimI-like enzyme